MSRADFSDCAAEVLKDEAALPSCMTLEQAARAGPKTIDNGRQCAMTNAFNE